MTIFLQATFEGLSLGAIYSLVAIGFVLICTSVTGVLAHPPNRSRIINMHITTPR